MSDIKTYPVSQKQLDFFYSLDRISDTIIIQGIKYHEVFNIDRDSGATIKFYVYVTPKFTTNFTSIIKTPLENERKT